MHPLAVKEASPIVSETRKVFSMNFVMLLLIAIARRIPRKEKMMFEGWINIRGSLFTSKSLKTPPPSAVEIPTTDIPKKSSFFVIPFTAPEKAKEIRPIVFNISNIL